MDITKFVLQGQRSVTLSDDVAGNLQNEIEELTGSVEKTNTSIAKINDGYLGNVYKPGALFSLVEKSGIEVKDALPCDGSHYKASAYPELFDAIGYNYNGDYERTAKNSLVGVPDPVTTTYRTVGTYYFCGSNMISIRYQQNQSSYNTKRIQVYIADYDGNVTSTQTPCDINDANLLLYFMDNYSTNSDKMTYIPNNYGNISFYNDELIFCYCTTPDYSGKNYTLKYVYSKDCGKTLTIKGFSYTLSDSRSSITGRIVAVNSKYIYFQVRTTDNKIYKVNKETFSDSTISDSNVVNNLSTKAWYWIQTGEAYCYLAIANDDANGLLYVLEDETLTRVSNDGGLNLNGRLLLPFSAGGIFLNGKLYVTNKAGNVIRVEFTSKDTIKEYKTLTDQAFAVPSDNLLDYGFEYGGRVFLHYNGDSRFIVINSDDTVRYISLGSVSYYPHFTGDEIIAPAYDNVLRLNPDPMFRTPVITQDNSEVYIRTKGGESA